MKVILLGHGHCASGYLSSLEMIAGKQEHVEAIDFSDAARRRTHGAIDRPSSLAAWRSGSR